jgi:hypothetical protein
MAASPYWMKLGEQPYAGGLTNPSWGLGCSAARKGDARGSAGNATRHPHPVRSLGDPSERTYQRWRRGDVAHVSSDTIFRLGALLGIHKALRYMFAAPERGYTWVRKPNAAFGGSSALDKMLQGAPTDLAEVRAYLDAERGGW